VASASRNGTMLAVLFVDLDGFAAVNDTAGHAAGDALLAETAARLRGCVRKSDLVARLGGDEFAVVLTEMRQPADAAIVARNAIETLSKPYSCATPACSCRRASASPSTPTTASTRSGCCATPTSRCTGRSRTAAASTPSSRPR
jgi:diguanylate cyclase (GGDEF)-like protein